MTNTHLFAFNAPGPLCPKCGGRLAVRKRQGRQVAVCEPCGILLVNQGQAALPAKCLKGNPPGPVQIYKPTKGIVISGMQKPAGHPCDTACARANHKYTHRFKEPVEIIGKADGNVLLRGRKR